MFGTLARVAGHWAETEVNGKELSAEGVEEYRKRKRKCPSSLSQSVRSVDSNASSGSIAERSETEGQSALSIGWREATGERKLGRADHVPLVRHCWPHWRGVHSPILLNAFTLSFISLNFVIFLSLFLFPLFFNRTLSAKEWAMASRPWPDFCPEGTFGKCPVTIPRGEKEEDKKGKRKEKKEKGGKGKKRKRKEEKEKGKGNLLPAESIWTFWWAKCPSVAVVVDSRPLCVRGPNMNVKRVEWKRTPSAGRT
ncbi:hypothetical protein GPALN_005642 [Globodera pallida]|nr:hypothetical protein GPALN_005642 [Globodera pallida]